MSRDDRSRLEDIAEAIAAIDAHRASSGAAEQAILHDALLYRLLIIGEAVKGLSDETRESECDVPWRDIAGLRDLIAHQYFRIDTERILQIVDADLPPLKAAVGRLLGT